MASNITPSFLFDTIDGHLSARDDLWHVVNGPKRETWFNAESIAALSHASPTAVSSGFRVYGEESYHALAEILSTFDLSVARDETDGWKRIPDITVLENCGNDSPVILTIVEAKLISPTSTKADDDVKLASNCDAQVKTLHSTVKYDGLLDQLNRAKRLFPSAQVFGLVFAVHRRGQCEQLQAHSFFDDLTTRINALFAETPWCLWDDKVKAFVGLQGVEPLGGMFKSHASVGLGILMSSDLDSSAKGATDAE